MFGLIIVTFIGREDEEGGYQLKKESIRRTQCSSFWHGNGEVNGEVQGIGEFKYVLKHVLV